MKFIFTAFLVIIFTLPFHFALNPMQGIDLMVTRIIGLLLFGCVLIFCFLKRQCSFHFSLQTFFLASFFVIAALSLFLTEHLSWGVRKYIFFLTLVPFYVLTIYFVAWKESSFMRIQKSIIWSGAVIASVGIAQFMIQFIVGLENTMDLWQSVSMPFLGNSLGTAVVAHNSWLVNVAGIDLFRAIAFFPDPHIYAFYLGMIAPLAIGFYIKTDRSLYAWIALFIIVADLLTFSRGGYVGLIAGLSIYFILFFTRLRSWHKITLGICLSILLLLLVIPSNPITHRLMSSFDTTEGSNRERLVNWQQAYDIINAYPLTGVGLGGYISHVDPRADYRTPIYAHNLYLDIIAEVGIGGLLAWLSFLLAILVAFFSSRREPLMVAGGVSVIVFMAHSFFETALFSVHIFTLLMIIAGLSSAQISLYGNEEK